MELCYHSAFIGNPPTLVKNSQRILDSKTYPFYDKKRQQNHESIRTLEEKRKKEKKTKTKQQTMKKTFGLIRFEKA